MAAESKRKMLYFLAMMDRRGIAGAQAYLGFPYNPYLTRDKYGHSYTKQIMDMLLMFSDSVLPNWPAKMSDHGDINVDAERTGKT